MSSLHECEMSTLRISRRNVKQPFTWEEQGRCYKSKTARYENMVSINGIYITPVLIIILNGKQITRREHA